MLQQKLKPGGECLSSSGDVGSKNVLPGDEYWSPEFNRRGVWGSVHAIGDDDGEMVIGGQFSFVGTTPALNIARWDGTAWQSYGDGVGETESYLTPVQAIRQFDGRLVVGGDLFKAGQDTVLGVRAAYWDGSAWHAMDQSDWQGTVRDLEVYHGRLYAGGTFWNDQSIYQGVLVWDGVRWQSVDASFQHGWDLLVVDDKLVVAGAYLYSWDDVSWSLPYGVTTGGGFMCLTEWNGALVAGGTVNGIRYGDSWVGVRNVALWNGAGWQALDGGLYGYYISDDVDVDYSAVLTLAVHDGVLCAGGRFELTSVDGQEVGAPYAAAWTGDHWEGLGGGTTGYVYAMAVRGADLVVGGWMAYAGHVDLRKFTGDVDVWGLGLWDGQNWRGTEPLGKGLNGTVHCLGVYDDRVIAAGDFELAGAAKVKGIAAFDGESWSPMGGGLTYGGVYPRICSAMQEYEGDLIVGGRIVQAGDVAVANVARWDGESWSAMGAGIPEEVQALCVWDGVLYAGRYRWTGSMWEEIFPVDGEIAALCVWNDLLVLGGTFHNVGSVAANNVAAWNGSEFFPLGEGTDLGVVALAVYGHDLIAGGNFSAPAKRLARWDGTAWSGLGGGVGTSVYCLSVVGNSLFVGGVFTYAFNEESSVLVNYVARWDGALWHALGSGCNEPAVYRPAVYGIVPYHDVLYVGGDYTMAGGRPSWWMGEWRDPSVPVYLRRFSAERSGSTVVVRCELGDPLSGARLEVWREVPGRERSRVGELTDPGSTSLMYTDPAPPAGEADYWLREVNATGIESWYGPAHLAAAPLPERLALTSVAPNPFNPRTTIRYSLPQATHAALGLYDQRGRLVRSLVDASLPAGEQVVEWDGRDAHGALAASGTYIVRLVTEQGVRASKITLAK